MGKKRIDSMFNKKTILHKSDKNESSLNPSVHNFIYDEVDDFHDTEIPNEIITFDGSGGSYPEEQVLGLGRLSSDEESDDEESADVGKVNSDEEEYFLPDDDIVDTKADVSDDERAWGKKKRLFFGTDTTDERIHREALTRRNKEEHQEMEEEGAKRLQERMADQLQGLSFVDLIPTVDKSNNVVDEVKDRIKVDVSRLSVKKKIRLLKQESPEFFPLVEDLKGKCIELKSVLQPLMDAMKLQLIESSPVMDYLKARYCLTLNYLTVVCSYMMVKSSGASVTSHPVVERLAQYRHLFKELDPCQTLYDAEIHMLLKDLNAGKLKTIKKKNNTKKMLSLLKKEESITTRSPNVFSLLDSDTEDDDDKGKTGINYDSEEQDSVDDMELENANEGEETLDKDERRTIGSKILKNKGLMAKRNKEKGNPRVRYKNKYKNKLKRRKGQVQNVSKELYRYGGEITGIKSSVIKSRKLK